MKLQSNSDGILDHEMSRSEAPVAKNVVETCNLGRHCVYGICRDKKEKGREMFEAF